MRGVIFLVINERVE